MDKERYIFEKEEIDKAIENMKKVLVEMYGF